MKKLVSGVIVYLGIVSALDITMDSKLYKATKALVVSKLDSNISK